MLLPGGGVLIDTPGKRSFGLADDEGGVAAGFGDVLDAAADCRFRDCRHVGEPGCAVAAAEPRAALPARSSIPSSGADRVGRAGDESK